VAPAHVQLWTIFKGCFPFLSMVFLCMAIVYVFPDIVAWLPDKLYGN
jgi:TRAP-type mannitol/chloroaromatic compound transport system permease large subunit